MKIHNAIYILACIVLASCNSNKFEHDASGTFEATEIIVSSEASGKIESLNLTEGDILQKGQYVGYIDSTQTYLKKLQLLASHKSVTASRPSLNLQIAATREQIAKAETEKRRVGNLFAAGAATQKQVDDADSQLRVLQKTLQAQTNSISTSVNSLDEQASSVDIQIAQAEDMLTKCKITSPISGTVLNKYSEEGEVTSPGKPLFKIADTQNLYLRAYIVSEQLGNVKIGQNVIIFINQSEGTQKSYKGRVTWISDKAEFTPKTIQTKDERQNLVYAIKVAVTNTDGLIKIGMYGDLDFNAKNK